VGRRASRAQGSKGARTCGGGRRLRGRGRVHGGGTWAGGWGRADRWGRRDRERTGCTCERTALTDLAHGATRERERERGRAGWRRQAGPACQALRARAQARLNGPTGLKWVFYFPGNF
jgi:hypothetical protein